MSYNEKQLKDGRVYSVQGSLRDAFLCRESEYLVAGPAGTGKSRAVLEKLYALAIKYEGCRIMIARKTRHSLTQTALVTFEQEVVPAGSPILGSMQRKNRQEYQFPNGSVIAVGGMDVPDKILSSQYDVIYFQEATECTEEDWEMASSRLRNYRIPYQQMIGDCNPSFPTHWLKKRCDSGKTAYFNSTHEDNPVLYNWDKQEWTSRGVDYLSKLDKLSGARYMRLRKGIWAQPEGARWPNFNRDVHCFEPYKMWPRGVPESWIKWVSLDYGKADPYCCLWHTMPPDGRDIYTYREDYLAGMTADEQARRICEMSPSNERFARIMCDPHIWDKFPNHTNEEYSKKSAKELYEPIFIDDGRFGPMEKGYNRDRGLGFMFLDSIMDYESKHTPNWHIAHGCTNLINEIESAVYDRDASGAISENVDPSCPDHAITCSVYGLHGNYAMLDPRANEVDLEKVAQEQARITAEESYEGFRTYSESQNNRRSDGIRLGGSRQGGL